jgi:hypothetical protein
MEPIPGDVVEGRTLRWHVRWTGHVTDRRGNRRAEVTTDTDLLPGARRGGWGLIFAGEPEQRSALEGCTLAQWRQRTRNARILRVADEGAPQAPVMCGHQFPGGPCDRQRGHSHGHWRDVTDEEARALRIADEPAPVGAQ